MGCQAHLAFAYAASTLASESSPQKSRRWTLLFHFTEGATEAPERTSRYGDLVFTLLLLGSQVHAAFPRVAEFVVSTGQTEQGHLETNSQSG